MIDSTWLRPGIARNDYLLARSRPGRRKRKPDSRWPLVLGVAVDETTGWIDRVTFERDFNCVMPDDDPINCGSDQFADIRAPRSARSVRHLIIAAPSTAERLHHQLLDLIGADAGSRTRFTITQLSLTDVIAVAVPAPHRIGRRHPVTAVVEDYAGEKSAAGDAGLSTLRQISREPGLNGIPQFLVHDRVVLARLRDALVHHFPAVNSVP